MPLRNYGTLVAFKMHPKQNQAVPVTAGQVFKSNKLRNTKDCD